jgi:hypothetical protein
MADQLEQPPEWGSLDRELLALSFTHLEKAERHRALTTCTGWAHALLHAPVKPSQRLDVRRTEPFAWSAQVLQKLWRREQEEEQPSQGITLCLGDSSYYTTLTFTSLKRCLDELRAASVPLTCVRRLELKVSASRSVLRHSV